MIRTRAYLRASTSDQNPERARHALEEFALEHKLDIVHWHVESESGAKLARPELFALIANAKAGDILLIEQVDRLSRLNAADWETLKLKLGEKRIRIVALDLPTSWMSATASTDPTTVGLLTAVNSMLLDMLAVVARKDYTDRRRRQVEGITKAKTAGLYKGRPMDTEKHLKILDMLDHEMSWSAVQDTMGVSRSTILRAVNLRKKAAVEVTEVNA